MQDNIEEPILKQPTNQYLGYANFWQRLQALIFDSFFFMPLTYLNGQNIMEWKRMEIVVLVTLVWCIYKPLMEWKFGATLGKMVLGLRIVNAQHEKISFNQAMLRFTPYFAWSLAVMLDYIALFNMPGFDSMKTVEEIMQLQQDNPSPTGAIVIFAIVFSSVRIFFDPAKQAYHDKLGDTYCVIVNRNANVKEN